MSVLTATGSVEATTGVATDTNTLGTDDTSTKVWSATRLKTYLTCPRQFHYAYVGLIPSVPTSPLVFGRVLHEVLCFTHEQQMQQGHLPPVPETLHFFDALWKRALEEEQPLFRPSAPSPEHHTTLAHEVLRAFLSAQADARPPLAVELAFEVEAKGHRLCGIIDRVDEGEQGLILVDYKSGSRKPPLQEVERELQFTLYAFAAQQVLGQPVEQVVHYHLRDGSRILTQRDESSFAWLLDEVLPHVVQAVEREEFAPHFGHWCNWCDFRELCRAQNIAQQNNIAHERAQQHDRNWQNERNIQNERNQENPQNKESERTWPTPRS